MLTLAAVFAVAFSVALLLGVFEGRRRSDVLFSTRDPIRRDGERRWGARSPRGEVLLLAPGDVDPRD